MRGLPTAAAALACCLEDRRSVGASTRPPPRRPARAVADPKSRVTSEEARSLWFGLWTTSPSLRTKKATHLVWGGVRGGVSIALALDVDPAIPGREAIVATAFGIVVFTLLVQGSFVRAMMRRARPLTPSGTTAR